MPNGQGEEMVFQVEEMQTSGLERGHMGTVRRECNWGGGSVSRSRDTPEKTVLT